MKNPFKIIKTYNLQIGELFYKLRKLQTKVKRLENPPKYKKDDLVNINFKTYIETKNNLNRDYLIVETVYNEFDFDNDYIYKVYCIEKNEFKTVRESEIVGLSSYFMCKKKESFNHQNDACMYYKAKQSKYMIVDNLKYIHSLDLDILKKNLKEGEIIIKAEEV